MIACECLAQLRTENAERTYVLGEIHSDGAPQREPRNAGSKSAHEPVPFFLGRAINNVESLFQLFEQSRDFFGRMLQIVIHRHDHIVFRRANGTEQSVMLAIVAH